MAEIGERDKKVRALAGEDAEVADAEGNGGAGVGAEGAGDPRQKGAGRAGGSGEPDDQVKPAAEDGEEVGQRRAERQRANEQADGHAARAGRRPRGGDLDAGRVDKGDAGADARPQQEEDRKGWPGQQEGVARGGEETAHRHEPPWRDAVGKQQRRGHGAQHQKAKLPLRALALFAGCAARRRGHCTCPAPASQPVSLAEMSYSFLS